MTAIPTPAPAGLDELVAWLRAGGLAGKPPVAHSNQGELYRHRLGENEFIIKTPLGNPLAWRLRRSTLKREFSAYRRLDSVPGFATCHGLVDERWLILDFIEGRPFRDGPPPDPERFFSQLLAVIQAMHERGVAHGDLKRKSNLLVDRHGQPVILDLGTAIVRKPGWRPLNRRLFEFIRQTDLNAWVKLKYGGYREIGAADLAYLKRSRLERILGRMRRG